MICFFCEARELAAKTEGRPGSVEAGVETAFLFGLHVAHASRPIAEVACDVHLARLSKLGAGALEKMAAAGKLPRS